ncbi:hypothetical protein ACFYWX_39575 [Streptomyces sp. NPDC002888]|uniref:hypothetical protein n=1 Tax=Streptomyces sp. NPDC002888 TaxID=3364668 RepID=UPI00369F7D62
MPQRRAQIHKTHREVIRERAGRDQAALKPLPPTPCPPAQARRATSRTGLGPHLVDEVLGRPVPVERGPAAESVMPGGRR